MDATMAIAASGMAAASQSLTASASNIANMQTAAPIPASGPLQPVPQNSGAVYQAVDAIQQNSPGGGVATAVFNVRPSYMLAYDPSAPFANLQGMVATPNVELINETVNLISASAAFRAEVTA